MGMVIEGWPAVIFVRRLSKSGRLYAFLSREEAMRFEDYGASTEEKVIGTYSLASLTKHIRRRRVVVEEEDIDLLEKDEKVLGDESQHEKAS